MDRSLKVSMAVVRRLPKYYRYLGELSDKGIKRISSKELGNIMSLTASQIRQDLNCFGGFGQQGYGYNVDALRGEIAKILGLDHEYNLVIFGAGNLGQALANYTNFGRRGFRVLALFDTNPKLIGLKIRDVEVVDVDKFENFMDSHSVDMAVICTPKDKAQDVADMIVESGIKGIWNFAPVDLRVPDYVSVENVNLSESLLTLSYLMKESTEG